MMRYEVLWVADEANRRDYGDRQVLANAAKADVYIEQHLNALGHDAPGIEDNPAMCLVGHNASKKSVALAETYSGRAAVLLGTRDAGAYRVPYRGRGDYNLRITTMPAILLEPAFVSDPTQAEFLLDWRGRDLLADVLVSTVVEHFPSGARVALSTGHLFKRSKPHDRGAPCVISSEFAEGDLSHDILERAAVKLRKLCCG